eukprot:m51a1_g4060 hypothetical protein (291) ;mRNA; r:732017-732953
MRADECTRILFDDYDASSSTDTSPRSSTEEEQRNLVREGLVHEALTPEVLRVVFGHVGPWEWTSLAAVCRSWRAVARDDAQLWESWAEQYLPSGIGGGGRPEFVRQLLPIREARAKLVQRLVRRGLSISGAADAAEAPEAPEAPDDEVDVGPRPAGRSGGVRFARAADRRRTEDLPWELGMEEVLRPAFVDPQLGFMFTINECGGPLSLNGMLYSRNVTLVGQARVAGNGDEVLLTFRWASEASYGREADWQLRTSELARTRSAVLRVDANKPRAIRAAIQIGGVDIALR